ncbi:MAG: type III pantothenate kinase [Bdellovibrionaceae bacterium]|nr:type III pantothenate kinase [Pseudobdellovibrionaceae bacterium]
MMLCLDVGNTQIYGGVYNQEGEIKHRFRMTTSAVKTSDEIGIFLKAVLEQNGVEDISQIKRVGVCSVVPQQDHSMKNAILKYFKVQPFFLEAGVKTGIKLKSPNPKEVGADRIASAIAGSHNFENKNLVIVDFGTAITVDVINSDKDYLGGVILAGVRLSVEALGLKTAKLPIVQVQKPERTVGRTTVECIQSGIFYGTVGSIKEIVSRIKTEAFAGQDSMVIATGGFAGLFKDEKLFDLEAPDLVLDGLRICYLKNL